MNELALFSGGGGGLLASKLLGWRSIGYVEINEYCQQTTARRIADGILDDAPIFSDLRAFNREGYAKSYSGMVEVVSGGFPCQDLSCAGKGEGIHGERSGLWFEMAETVRIVRPGYVFIENVPMLLVRGFEYVLGELSEMGFNAAWGIVSAADVGAPHLRKRLWIVAQSMPCRRRERRTWRFADAGSGKPESERTVYSENVGHTISNGRGTIRQNHAKHDRAVIGTNGEHPRTMADATRFQQGWKEQRSERERTGVGRESIDTDAYEFDGNDVGYGSSQILRRKWEQAELQRLRWWQSEPALGRVAHGVANRVDRLRAIGNGQVPAVAATAWVVLKKALNQSLHATCRRVS